LAGGRRAGAATCQAHVDLSFVRVHDLPERRAGNSTYDRRVPTPQTHDEAVAATELDRELEPGAAARDYLRDEARPSTEAVRAGAAAKAYRSEVAVKAGSELFALCGTSSAASGYDPVDRQYHHLAGYELADVQPPNRGRL
jgi:hypothetical protein